MDDQNKNLILASVLSFVVIIVWFILFPPPEPTQTEEQNIEKTQAQTHKVAIFEYDEIRGPSAFHSLTKAESTIQIRQ